MLSIPEPCSSCWPAQLKSLFESLPTDAAPSTISRNLALVQRLGRPEYCSALLRALLDDRRLLREVAARSYMHVNHFAKIVLIDTGADPGYRLTLHLWQPPYTERQLREELIHDHRFSFWSTILTGTLTSQNYTFSEQGSGFRRYRYSPEKVAERTARNSYEFVGLGTLRETERLVQRAGDSYYLDYTSTHRVVLPLRDATCTLVIRGPRRRSYSNIYNTFYPEYDTANANVPFTLDELELKLERLSALVDARGPRPALAALQGAPP